MNNNHGRRRTRRVRQQRKQQKTQIGRILLTVGLMALIAVVSIGGTMAWLTDSTVKIENTFTTSNLNIALTETDEDKQFKMVPGSTIAKDPKITVAQNSEALWLFVKAEETAVLDTFITYAIDSAWTQLVIDGVNVDGVYYREVDATTAATGVEYNVLASNQVTVNSTVTKADMDGLANEGAVQPKLSFTAFAVQKENISSVEEAWNQVKNLTAKTNP